MEIILEDLGKIGVIIAGDIAKDEIAEAIVKALVVEGLTASSVSLSYVSDMGVLPYAAVTLAKTVKLVVASSVVTHDPKGTFLPTYIVPDTEDIINVIIDLGVETQALTSALHNIGIQGTHTLTYV